jgi:hypothetical protein
MNVVEVWRIEDANGFGPYPGFASGFERSENVLELAHEISWAHGDWAHPGPREDGIDSATSKHFFGCPSREKLIEWFSEFWLKLQKAHHDVVCYQVPEKDVIYGSSGRQVAFKRDKATKEVMPW